MSRNNTTNIIAVYTLGYSQAVPIRIPIIKCPNNFHRSKLDDNLPIL